MKIIPLFASLAIAPCIFSADPSPAIQSPTEAQAIGYASATANALSAPTTPPATNPSEPVPFTATEDFPKLVETYIFVRAEGELAFAALGEINHSIPEDIRKAFLQNSDSLMDSSSNVPGSIFFSLVKQKFLNDLRDFPHNLSAYLSNRKAPVNELIGNILVLLSVSSNPSDALAALHGLAYNPSDKDKFYAVFACVAAAGLLGLADKEADITSDKFKEILAPIIESVKKRIPGDAAIKLNTIYDHCRLIAHNIFILRTLIKQSHIRKASDLTIYLCKNIDNDLDDIFQSIDTVIGDFSPDKPVAPADITANKPITIDITDANDGFIRPVFIISSNIDAPNKSIIRVDLNGEKVASISIPKGKHVANESYDIPPFKVVLKDKVTYTISADSISVIKYYSESKLDPSIAIRFHAAKYLLESAISGFSAISSSQPNFSDLYTAISNVIDNYFILTSAGSDSMTDHKEIMRVLQWSKVCLDLLNARSQDQFNEVSDSITGPISLYRDLRSQGRLYVALKGYIGATGGVEWSRNASTSENRSRGSYVGIIAPVGVEFGWSTGSDKFSSLGLMLSPIDLGAITATRFDSKTDNQGTSLKQVFVPGAYLTAGISKNWPFSVGVGYQYSPNQRVDSATGASLRSNRVLAFVAIDVSLIGKLFPSR